MVYDISFSRCFCWDMYTYIHFSHTFCWSSLSHSSVPSPSSNLFQLSGWIRADENLNGWKKISHHQVWLTPRKINMESENCWSLQMSLLYNWFIFRFHVNFQGCNQKHCCFPVPLQLFVSHPTYGEKKGNNILPLVVSNFSAPFFFQLGHLCQGTLCSCACRETCGCRGTKSVQVSSRQCTWRNGESLKVNHGFQPMVNCWFGARWFGFRWFGQLTISWSFSFQKKN